MNEREVYTMCMFLKKYYPIIFSPYMQVFLWSFPLVHITEHLTMVHVCVLGAVQGPFKHWQWLKMVSVLSLSEMLKAP